MTNESNYSDPYYYSTQESSDVMPWGRPPTRWIPSHLGKYRRYRSAPSQEFTKRQEAMLAEYEKRQCPWNKRLHGLEEFRPHSYLPTDHNRQPWNSNDPHDREGYELWSQMVKIVELESKETFTISLAHYPPTLGCIQDYVGGYIECVHIPTGEQMICNEDGHALRLPVNEKASKYAGTKLLGNVMFLANRARMT